jgi:dUTP pyrophosphatase
VIDADYRGEVSVVLRNFGTRPFEVRAGDRIGQLLVLPLYGLYGSTEISAVELGETERGAGGFGSTGSS